MQYFWQQKDVLLNSYQLLREVNKFFFSEIPVILELSARSLRSKSIPISLSTAQALTYKEWILLAPTISVLFLILSLPIKLLTDTNGKSSNDTRRKLAREGSYYLTRIILWKFVGIIYFAAFITLAFQGRALYGTNGIFPLPSPSETERPTPFFSILREYFTVNFSDQVLEISAWSGVVLSSVMILGSFYTIFIPILLWLIYLSVLNLGTNMMHYGWEWLTVEIGFMTIFLAPIWSHTPLSKNTPASPVIIWLFRWLAFRLLIGAGMSKLGLRSSDCWMQLTCTTTHYFTQPMPNLFSWFAHHSSDLFHQTEVALTFFEQLVLPFALLSPFRRVRIMAAVLEIFFQGCILLTGNYAWINLIGALPCVAFFDDRSLAFLFSTTTVNNIDEMNGFSMEKLHISKEQSKWLRIVCWLYKNGRTLIYLFLLCVIIHKSAAPIKELFSESPWLHYYDDYFLVTSQGVFGFINQQRVVLALQYSHDKHSLYMEGDPTCKDGDPGLTDNAKKPLTCASLAMYCSHTQFGSQIRQHCPKTCNICSPKVPIASNWTNLDFKNLPGSLDRAPWFNSPIHYRLDWEVWIQTTASMESTYAKYRLHVPDFVQILISKILAGDTDAIGLMGTLDLFDEEDNPPTAIKAEYYLYTFTEWDELINDGLWWKREKISTTPARVFTAGDDKWPKSVTRESVHRNWVLFFLTMCSVMCFHVIAKAKKIKTAHNLIVLSLLVLSLACQTNILLNTSRQ